MKNTPYWKAMCSPFRRLTLKWYVGKTQVGTPYFLPRKLVYVSEAEAIEIANERCDKYDAKDIGYDYADELQKARRTQRFIPRRFGFDSVGLGWKTKWTDTDYRYEWSPLFSFVCFGYQIAVQIVPKLPKDVSRSLIDYYWESWLYYMYDTDPTKTPKERIAQAREARPGMITSYQKGKDPVTTCTWDSILRKKYLK